MRLAGPRHAAGVLQDKLVLEGIVVQGVSLYHQFKNEARKIMCNHMAAYPMMSLRWQPGEGEPWINSLDVGNAGDADVLRQARGIAHNADLMRCWT
jgi:hypothetical protein